MWKLLDWKIGWGDTDLFQKNLVVWKLLFIPRVTRNCEWVSEELSSVETSLPRFQLVFLLPVSEELSSVETEFQELRQ